MLSFAFVVVYWVWVLLCVWRNVIMNDIYAVLIMIFFAVVPKKEDAAW